MQEKPVALVTGANQGIGLQIAKELVKHGFTVLLVRAISSAAKLPRRRLGRTQWRSNSM